MMMAKDRDDRYQTPSELLRDIEQVIDGKMPERARLFSGESSVIGQNRIRRIAHVSGMQAVMLGPAATP